MADISKIKLPDGNTYDVKDTSKSSATNWVNGSAVGSIRTIYSRTESNEYTMGSYAVTEGGGTAANGSCAHAEGGGTTASGYNSHSEGGGTTASGAQSHAEGGGSQAIGDYSHAEGYRTIASGEASHAEGSDTTASGGHSHAEGYQTEATNSESHAEGYRTKATAGQTHAEGYGSEASSSMSHAEGYYTKASGNTSHAEGYQTIASGGYSHAEGYSTEAAGYNAHAEGSSTIASGSYSHVSGKYNKEDDSCYSKTTDTTIKASKTYYTYADGLYTAVTSPTIDNIDNYYEYKDSNGIYAEIVGNGAWNSTIRKHERSNARTLDWSGNEVLAGKLTVGAVGTNSLDVATIGQLPTKTSDLTNDSGFITTETDPVFSASAAASITETNISSWNAKVSDDKTWNGVQLNISSAPTTSNTYYIPSMSSIFDTEARLLTAVITPTAQKIPLYDNSAYLHSTTPSANDNSTKVATTAYVDGAIPTVPTKTSDLTNDSGFITGYTETDPVFTASAAHGISTTDITNWNSKQAALVSGTNIKTINGTSLLGSGNITITGGSQVQIVRWTENLTTG